MSTGDSTHVLILGGGFGGVYTALELDRRMARHPRLRVTIVNRENFFLFTPMLHEVAASDLDLTHIVNPIRKLLKRAVFVQASVESIDLDGRRVIVSHGDGHTHEIAYDQLVIGLGAVTNFYNLPGLADRAMTMKSLGDAIGLRNHLIDCLEQADFECLAGERPSLLTFVVAGGGFAGVETIAGLNDFVRDALRFYPHLSEALVRVVLVHAGPAILPELGLSLGEYARERLAARGVEIRVGTTVNRVDGDDVWLSDGTRIAARTLVWTAGTSPHPLIGGLPCTKERGRLLVNECLEVAGWPGVWALGDAAAIPDIRTGQFYPPTAQHAIREARTLAANIVAAVAGGRRRAFVFSTIGQLAAIGRRTGVARILGRNFSGFVAWFLWRTIYLSKLPRFEKKLRVALDWTLDLLFTKDLVQFSTHRGAEPASLPSIPRAEAPRPEAVAAGR